MAGKVLVGDSPRPSSAGILLYPNEAQTVSTVFRLTTTPLRLVAFGLMGDDYVRVNRVWLPPSDMGRSDCGDLLPSGAVLEQPHYVGSHVVMLKATKPEAVIDAAGEYRVEFVGENRTNVQVVSIQDSLVLVNDTVRNIS